MQYDFKEAQDVIKEMLGDNYEGVKSKLDKVFEVAQSQSKELKETIAESMKRKGTIAELRKESEARTAEYDEKLNAYEELSKKSQELQDQLEVSKGQLKGFHEQRKNVLKDYASKYDVLKDEKYAKVSSRFKGLEDIDKIEDNSIVERYISDFELLSLNEKEPANRAPNPVKESKEPTTGKYGY